MLLKKIKQLAGDSTSDLPPLENAGENSAAVSAEASRMEEVD